MRAIARWTLVLTMLSGCMGAPDADPTPSQSSPAPTPQGASVSIESYQYIPATVTIDAGAAVTWTNNGPYGGYDAPAATHTASATDESWTTYRIEYGNAASWVFDAPGEYPYKCNFHDNMTGTVVVR